MRECHAAIADLMPPFFNRTKYFFKFVVFFLGNYCVFAAGDSTEWLIYNEKREKESAREKDIVLYNSR